MTISMSQAQYLYSIGLTHGEVNIIAEATDPAGNPQPPIDTNSPFWQRVVYERQELVGKMQYEWNKSKKQELPREIQDRIFDQLGKGNPWAWLKLMYIPKKRLDYLEVQKQAQNKVELKKYGRAAIEKARRERRK